MSKFSETMQTNILAGLVPASVTEYTMINDRVARVIVATVANANTSQVRTALEQKLGAAAAVIRSSFRWLNSEKSALIGYVTLATPQRLLDTDKPETAGYRLIARNMYMSKEDESVWEMKKASAGTYMVRQGHDDLGELLENNRVSPRGATPRMASVITASAQPTELVAFVNSFGMGTPSIDYGFVVKRGDADVSVVTASYTKPIQVKPNEIVASYQLDASEVHRQLASSMERRSIRLEASDKSASVEYYKKLYSYAPEYLRKVLDEVEEMAAL